MPDPDARHPDTIHQIPLDLIDEAALIRDRSVIDGQALNELRLSIARHGLRLPVEVFLLADPQPPHTYGLISGLRRLMAFRALHETARDDRYSTIPALIRPIASTAEALAAVVEENEVRAQLSPWERGRVALIACDQGLFQTVDQAIDALYPSADRNKRSRLRALARVVERLDGHLTDPERVSLRQCLRMAAAIDKGYGELIHAALAETHSREPQHQWRLIQPILAEAEEPAVEPVARRPGRPRRLLRPRATLTIRRERTRDGWCLHFTGREAAGELIDEVLDEIERMFSPG